ncbi:PAS domain S-box-containing protein [Arcticibacter pallidicorallinus]|uniref:histidine kinase n=1 Tax=Arcticibacter pallidicorallinus TaxID=1259464 RepID=A0A2T0UBJ0_9SPHI|nr:PAS domain-containing sensor histidine kinase [Arcticibacter pallidicorallinus]PRY55306.1 PAS domain S-box-containing protein [Arcticibacter pallidicorallinus]
MGNDFDLEHYFELSPDGICIVGHDGICIRVNKTFAQDLGYSVDELIGKATRDLLYPDDRPRTQLAFEKMKHNLTLTNFENRYLTKTGQIRWFSWTAIPIESAQVYLGIAKDISHQRKLDDDRNQLLTKMTKSVDNLKQLTYATSHDLRAPVNNLLAVFSLLDVSKIPDPETRKFIDMLKLATDNLRSTLDTYVELLGKKDVMNISQEELDLRECFEVVTGSVASLIEHTHAEIRTDFSAFSRVPFNRLYMESIFLNLLTNSIKYAKNGSVPRIFVQTRLGEGVKQLVFSDAGQGFDLNQVKDRVFGLHQKFHNHHDSKGIGLYLVHHHVTSMGGRIQLESKPGEGATFIISFE